MYFDLFFHNNKIFAVPSTYMDYRFQGGIVARMDACTCFLFFYRTSLHNYVEAGNYQK